MHVVTVDFRIRPGQMQAFLPLMLAQARNSLELEPGCHVFDVTCSADDPAAVFLYEVYADPAAFDAHLASDHFRRFDAAVASMVEDKTVRSFTRLQPAGA